MLSSVYRTFYFVYFVPYLTGLVIISVTEPVEVTFSFYLGLLRHCVPRKDDLAYDRSLRYSNAEPCTRPEGAPFQGLGVINVIFYNHVTSSRLAVDYFALPGLGKGLSFLQEIADQVRNDTIESNDTEERTAFLRDAAGGAAIQF